MIRHVTFGYLVSTMSCCMPPLPLKNGARGILHSCLSVREWLRECACESVVPKTSRIPCFKKQWREFRRIFVTDVLGFVDVLISFCSQQVKGQGNRRQWPENLVNTISHSRMKGILPVLVTYVFVDVLIIAAEIKGQDHCRQWPEKPGEYNIFVNIFVITGSCIYLPLEHTD